MSIRRIAVLASGRGSNLQAIVDAIAAGRLQAEIVGVFSDRPDATALERVATDRRWGHAPKEFSNRAAYEQALGDALAASTPDWIVCAGYMRILGADFVQRFNGRLVNIHPSLLPVHKGLHTHARALEAGDSEHGASVHLVVPELDAGAAGAVAWPQPAQARTASGSSRVVRSRDVVFMADRNRRRGAGCQPRSQRGVCTGVTGSGFRRNLEPRG